MAWNGKDYIELLNSSNFKYRSGHNESLAQKSFDEMKNTATNRLEDWLEEDEDINQKSEFKRNSFYNEKEKESFLRNKKYDDPWI